VYWSGNDYSIYIEQHFHLISDHASMKMAPLEG